LDQYIIRGVQHNVPFCRDVLRNDDFIKGYTPTSFIAQHYPDGFSGGQLSEVERKQLVAIAREIARKRENALGSPPMTLTGHGDGSKEDEVVVYLGGMFGDSYLVKSRIDLEKDCSITASVTRLQKKEDDDVDEKHVIELCNLDYEPSTDLAQVSLAGEVRALQVCQNVSLKLFSFYLLITKFLLHYS
jgi:acetyl/propionyl-CoA carboxylase alpha subunit